MGMGDVAKFATRPKNAAQPTLGWAEFRKQASHNSTSIVRALNLMQTVRVFFSHYHLNTNAHPFAVFAAGASAIVLTVKNSVAFDVVSSFTPFLCSRVVYVYHVVLVEQVGLPFVLYLICKFVLPWIAAEFLHPGYGFGGGHRSFPWVFLFMTYARLLSFIAAKLRIPPIARAVLAIALHFSCFGHGYCLSPFSRSQKLVGFLPAALNCPRLSTYLPYYWTVPIFMTKSLVIHERLNRPFVKAACAVLLLAVGLWASVSLVF